MERFRTGQRVQVVSEHHHLCGRKGTVRSLNPEDGGAVVAIDGGLPDEYAIVIRGETFHDRTVLLPQDCQPVRI
jgi:hypothetical protein